ncbi:hypothetical protein Aduo_004210 [Ancylostoma duodenale]
MAGPLSLTCQIISGLSLIANLYLVYVYYICPVKVIKSYKYFFLITALQDIVYSICIILIVPVIISKDFAFVFLAVGPMYKQPGGQVLMIFFVLSFIFSLLIVTNSFIYRYIQVCRPRFFDTYQSRLGVTVVLLLNLSIIVNWLFIVYFDFWPTSLTIAQLSDTVLLLTGLNSSECAQLGLSLKYGLLNPLNLALVVEVLLLMSAMGGIMAFSALKISSTLKQATFSKNLRKMHRQLFTLLLLQTACPMTFLHTPCFLCFIFLFTGLKSTTAVSYIISILLALFPLFSPLIIIGFLNDYRNHTLVKLRLYKKASEAPSKSVFASEIRTTPVAQ